MADTTAQSKKQKKSASQPGVADVVQAYMAQNTGQRRLEATMGALLDDPLVWDATQERVTYDEMQRKLPTLAETVASKRGYSGALDDLLAAAKAQYADASELKVTEFWVKYIDEVRLRIMSDLRNLEAKANTEA
jgi:hypothetical protein